MAIVALIGRPNVGKSSIFNRLVGERRAIEAHESGTTRDRVYGDVEYKNKTVSLVDMAGLIGEPSEMDKLTNEQVKFAISQADLLIMTVDAIDGLLEEDKRIADIIRKYNKPVIVAVNKSDNNRLEDSYYQFSRLGFKEMVPVSAIHNIGITELTERVFHTLPHVSSKKQKENQIKVALVGRPNVGKSTLLNHFAQDERAIVSSTAGTTRDSIDADMQYKGKEIKFIDTAGIRRNGRVEVGIEKFSVLRSTKAIIQSDVVVVLLDATEGATAMDAHIAGIALESGKGIILAVNKWDAVVKREHYENDQAADDLAQRKFLAKLQTEFAYLPWAPAIFISGKEGLNDKKLIDIIIKIFDQRKYRISEEDLDLIKKTAEQNHPNLPMIYKINQSNINPPTFDVIINRPQTWHFSFSRFIENLVRQVNAYNGTSIKINTVPYHKSQR